VKAVDEATASIRTVTEVVDRHRKADVGAVASAVLTTGLMVAAITDFQRDCDAAAPNRLRDVIAWVAVGRLTAVVYGRQLRRRQQRPAD
jgi:hypothetical protein